MLTPSDIMRAAEAMVGHRWSWTSADLDGLIAALGLRRRDGPASDVILVPLSNDRMPLAGVVEGLSDGRIEAVSLYLTENMREDHAEDQALLDRVADEAVATLSIRFGKGRARPKKKKGRHWKIDGTELRVGRLPNTVCLTLMHLAHRAAFEGK